MFPRSSASIQWSIHMHSVVHPAAAKPRFSASAAFFSVSACFTAVYCVP